MSTSLQYFALSSLAEACYLRFDLFDYSSEIQLIDALQNISSNDIDFGGYFSASQAIDFSRTWKVISHQANTESGFSATLFRNRENGKYYYACRGTEDVQNDTILTDVADIVFDGLAINQIVDMYNDWQRITSLGVYQAAKLELLVTETALLSAEQNAISGLFEGPYEQYLRTRNDVIIDMPSGRVYTITLVDSNQLFSDFRMFGADIPLYNDVVAVGHSLGGHLAMAFSRLFPACSDVFSVNGAGYATGHIPGAGGNADTNIRNLFSMLGGSFAGNFEPSEILNLYGEKWLEITTMNSPYGLLQPGGHYPFFIEDASSNTLGHGKSQLTDALAVNDLFFRADQRLQTEDFKMVFEELNPKNRGRSPIFGLAQRRGT